MRKYGIAAWAAVFLMTGTLIFGQPSQGTPQARARLRENINTLMLLRMTEALDLTEAQAAKLYPALTRIEKDKGQLQARLGAEVREMRSALQKSGVADAELLAMVHRIREIRQTIKQKDEAIEALLEGELTPVQKAKYVIFTVDFYRGLGEAVTRAREMRGKVQRRP